LPLDARFRGHDEVGALMPHVVMTGIAARRFTGGLTEFDVEANTVRRMITELERRFPGLGHQIDEGMAVAIDGVIFQDAYQTQLNPDSEVVLIPKIGGG
jgi:molybdopterin converting factor small subunit